MTSSVIAKSNYQIAKLEQIYAFTLKFLHKTSSQVLLLFDLSMIHFRTSFWRLERQQHGRQHKNHRIPPGQLRRAATGIQIFPKFCSAGIRFRSDYSISGPAVRNPAEFSPQSTFPRFPIQSKNVNFQFPCICRAGTYACYRNINRLRILHPPPMWGGWLR